MPNHTRMQIAIIEDNAKYRECLAGGLAIFPDCEVVHKLSNALHIATHFYQTLPHIALIDINMPGLDGVAAVKEITEKFPTVHCIILTVLADMDMVIKCMQNGAKGYLVKDKDSITKIVDSMRILYHGNYNAEFPLNGTLANKILAHFAKKETTIKEKLDTYSLTDRQKEILLHLYEGKSYKQIADECNIALETLNSHIKAIYPKLSINSRHEIKGVLG
jgi:DNA-binding NarL/FixJ family response regulator